MCNKYRYPTLPVYTISVPLPVSDYLHFSICRFISLYMQTEDPIIFLSVIFHCFKVQMSEDYDTFT